VLSSPRVDKPSFFGAFVADLQPRHIITVIVLLALASALSRFLNAAFTRAAERHKSRGTYLPETATQMAVTRRLSNVAVWLTAGAMGLSQFPQLRVLSTGLLASAGLSGLVVGFAARGTLGNAIAGLTISFSQPVRIGDDIEIRGERGIVEDIHLIFTVVKLSDGRRLVIPNDTLANEVIKNATMGGVTRVARCDVLVPPGGAVELVREAMLLVARGYDALDRTATPEVLFVRIDERGTLLRLVAPCSDVKAAEKLVQKVLARATDVVFRRSLA
jgi:small-conductance mechanosensitive channel